MRRGNQPVSGYAQRLGFARNNHRPARATIAHGRHRAPEAGDERDRGRRPHPTPQGARCGGSRALAPDQLLANPANWRIHPQAQQDALAGALDQVGWVQQVLVNQRSGFVVDGHARVALALSRGEASVPVHHSVRHANFGRHAVSDPHVLSRDDARGTFEASGSLPGAGVRRTRLGLSADAAHRSVILQP
jgi:hypothetical protein